MAALLAVLGVLGSGLEDLGVIAIRATVAAPPGSPGSPSEPEPDDEPTLDDLLDHEALSVELREGPSSPLVRSARDSHHEGLGPRAGHATFPDRPPRA